MHDKSKEKVYYEEDDGTVYQRFLDIDIIEDLYFWLLSGEITNYAWPKGGRLINLSSDVSDIKIENVVPDYNKNDYEY